MFLLKLPLWPTASLKAAEKTTLIRLNTVVQGHQHYYLKCLTYSSAATYLFSFQSQLLHFCRFCNKFESREMDIFLNLFCKWTVRLSKAFSAPVHSRYKEFDTVRIKDVISSGSEK